ncbi:MAG: flagellar hook-length control protein FliK [Magnetococcales bacterium]|nr:flagellar hook-length control protein FliK [Magnetococcales bacterium]
MVIEGVLPQSGSLTPAQARAVLDLRVGEILTGRITELKGEGQGVFRLPSGAGLAFTGGYGLSVGEQVQLEVVRLTPEIALRLAGSESRAALTLAQTAEQSLARAPDLFSKLMSLTLLSPSAESESAAPAPFLTPSPEELEAAWPPSSRLSLPAQSLSQLPAGQTRAALGFEALVQGLGKEGMGEGLGPLNRLPTGLLLTTPSGETLNQLVQRALPQVSAEGLLGGDPQALIKLLHGGAGRSPLEAAQRLRQGAEALQLGEAAEGLDAAARSEARGELAAARHALSRLADLVQSQEVLARPTPLNDGGVLLGYRVFWAPEGGYGEAMWKREPGSRGESGEENKGITTALLNLQMSRLGSVQARLSFGEGQLQVGLAAEREEAIAALRGEIGALRGGLQAAGLPLRTLDVARLSGGEMRQERQRMLGSGGGFALRA